jgi:hypothetical protein
MGNMKKMMYQSKGVKPTQEEFDAATSEQRRVLQDKYGDYKISADTPTLAELQAAEKKQQEINKKKKSKPKKMGGMYKEGGLKKSTASEFLSPPSVSNIDN